MIVFVFNMLDNTVFNYLKCRWLKLRIKYIMLFDVISTTGKFATMKSQERDFLVLFPNLLDASDELKNA